MEVLKLADAIREEIKRQARDETRLVATDHPDKPDVLRLAGSLDVYELAKALTDR